MKIKFKMNSAVKATTASFILALFMGGVEATRIHSAAEIMARSHSSLQWGGFNLGSINQNI